MSIKKFAYPKQGLATSHVDFSPDEYTPYLYVYWPLSWSSDNTLMCNLIYWQILHWTLYGYGDTQTS